MALKMLGVLLAFFIIGCDSPMNNRVRDSGEGVKSLGQELVFPHYGYRVQLQWLRGPFGSLNQDNHLMVIISTESGERVSLLEGLSLEFYSTMPSMGHPMDSAGFFEELEEGIYLNEGIRYNMPGDWLNELWLVDQDAKIMDRLQWSDFF